MGFQIGDLVCAYGGGDQHEVTEVLDDILTLVTVKKDREQTWLDVGGDFYTKASRCFLLRPAVVWQKQKNCQHERGELYACLGTDGFEKGWSCRHCGFNIVESPDQTKWRGAVTEDVHVPDWVLPIPLSVKNVVVLGDVVECEIVNGEKRWLINGSPHQTEPKP